MTNCPNCGAPIEPYKIHCDYCGSWYFDFCAFDCDTDKPVYVKFKTTQMGTPIAITALTIPRIETIESTCNINEVRDLNGATLSHFTSSRSCEIDAKFTCIPNKDHSLFTIEKL